MQGAAGSRFTLALDDVIQLAPEYAELLALVDIVKVDIQPLSRIELMQLTMKLKPMGKQLLAEKVDSREQMEQCQKLGFTLFQGYYFAKPMIIAGRKLDHSQQSLMKLMGLLLSDAETSELEAALKPEPGLTVNLLRMTNSVGAGCTEKSTRWATPSPPSAGANSSAGCNCWFFPRPSPMAPAIPCSSSPPPVAGSWNCWPIN